MKPETRGFRCRGNVGDTLERSTAAAAASSTASARLPDVGQLDLHLRVLREVLRHGQVDRTAVRLETIGSRLETRRHVAGVAHEELGCVDEHAITGGGGDREAPDDGSREPVPDGPDFRGIVGDGPEAVVWLHDEHARADALEL